MAGITKPVDPKVIKAVVNTMDPVTLWRWKKVIDERVELERDNYK